MTTIKKDLGNGVIVWVNEKEWEKAKIISREMLLEMERKIMFNHGK